MTNFINSRYNNITTTGIINYNSANNYYYYDNTPSFSRSEVIDYVLRNPDVLDEINYRQKNYNKILPRVFVLIIHRPNGKQEKRIYQTQGSLDRAISQLYPNFRLEVYLCRPFSIPQGMYSYDPPDNCTTCGIHFNAGSFDGKRFASRHGGRNKIHRPVICEICYEKETK